MRVRGNIPPPRRTYFMRIVVWRSPKFLRAILAKLFGIEDK